MSNPLFENRKLVIATKHSKEKVIAPLLEKALNVHCFTPENFDTDTLGTFSGEIERTEDPIATARKKCLLAMEASGCDLGIASEGSFGTHPSLFFAQADDEFLLFIDKKNELEIIARELSTDTNFNAKKIHSEKELMDFADLIQFPSHGLILRKTESDTESMTKGITDTVLLKKSFHELMNESSSVYVETDMRALYNPTRMSVIEKAAKKLVEKILSCCPNCETPGFGVTDVKSGLPCGLCGSATKSTLSFVHVCHGCEHEMEEKFPHGKTIEDPMYCDFCNP